MKKALGLTLVVLGAASFAFAGVVTAPEIDASSGAAALGLLTGGLVLHRARKANK